MAKLGGLKNVQTRTGTQDSKSPAFTVRDIPIGDIQTKENIRQDYTEIDGLASSIKQHGLLQPITVYSDGDGFAVKTGYRRFVAYQKLYEEDSERFHSIRCIITDSENIGVIQLIENVQRTDLSQIDLYNALAALRDQGMTLKQIAEGIGKTEKYIKNLFVGINEISNNERLQEFIGSPAGGTIQDIVETKGIPDETDRLNLLEQRKNGHITRSEMREKVRKLKGSPKPAKDREHDKKAIPPQKKKVIFSVREQTREIVISAADKKDTGTFLALQKDLEQFFAQSRERYDYQRIATKEDSGF